MTDEEKAQQVAARLTNEPYPVGTIVVHPTENRGPGTVIGVEVFKSGRRMYHIDWLNGASTFVPHYFIDKNIVKCDSEQ